MNAIIYLNSNGRVFIKRIAEIEKAVVFKIQFVEDTMNERNICFVKIIPENQFCPIGSEIGDHF